MSEAEEKAPSVAAQTITHLAFYAGWPRAMSAMAVAREVFGRSDTTGGKES